MRIIQDLGYLKIQLILIGLLLYYTSINFNIFSNYLNCSLNFIFKHFGIFIIITVAYLYVTVGYELGLNYDQLIKLNGIEIDNKHQVTTLSYVDEKKNDKNISYVTVEEQLLFNIEKRLCLFNKVYCNNSKSNNNNVNNYIHNYNYNNNNECIVIDEIFSKYSLQLYNNYDDKDINVINSRIMNTYSLYIDGGTNAL
ncbi:hypothetical protein PIROE2DRAFT_4238 [Piromyces sp. E2]|nr:hypothetical protein PIROE2DRAFT_4238 [Piromyces sp. E2]|eukprot:OUM68103.1 hypothetical protein PIROE2DRAFT_4238 [Piromyces sp. E2]